MSPDVFSPDSAQRGVVGGPGGFLRRFGVFDTFTTALSALRRDPWISRLPGLMRFFLDKFWGNLL